MKIRYKIPEPELSITRKSARVGVVLEVRKGDESFEVRLNNASLIEPFKCHMLRFHLEGLLPAQIAAERALDVLRSERGTRTA